MSETSLTIKSLTLLIEQGAPAAEVRVHADGKKEFFCRYSTETGLRCAVGILLPEEDAKYLEKEASGATIRTVVEREAEGGLSGLSREAKSFLKGNRGELENLQKVHDTRAEMSPEDFTDSLKRCLKEYKNALYKTTKENSNG